MVVVSCLLWRESKLWSDTAVELAQTFAETDRQP